MRTNRTLTQRFADWLRYTVADSIDRDGAPKSAGARFTIEDGIGRVWHEGHYGPGCPVWYIGGEEDYRKAHADAEPRPLAMGDEVLLFPVVEGAAAIRAMFTPHYRPRLSELRPPSPYETGVCPECGRLVEIEWVDATMPGGYVERVPGRWACRTVGCKYGEPGATLTITFEGTSATFGPIGPPHREDPQ